MKTPHLDLTSTTYKSVKKKEKSWKWNLSPSCTRPSLLKIQSEKWRQDNFYKPGLIHDDHNDATTTTKHHLSETFLTAYKTGNSSLLNRSHRWVLDPPTGRRMEGSGLCDSRTLHVPFTSQLWGRVRRTTVTDVRTLIRLMCHQSVHPTFTLTVVRGLESFHLGSSVVGDLLHLLRLLLSSINTPEIDFPKREVWSLW